jgi:hypothetical protein
LGLVAAIIIVIHLCIVDSNYIITSSNQYWVKYMKPLLELVSKEYNRAVGLEKVYYLQAAGSYTDVHYLDHDGEMKRHEQSKNIKTFLPQLDDRFLVVRRGSIINREHVDCYYHNRTIKLRMPGSPTFIVPKAMWKHVKAVLSGKISTLSDQHSISPDQEASL